MPETDAPEQDEEVLSGEQCKTLQAIGIPMDEIHALFHIRRLKLDGFGTVVTVIQNGEIKYLRPEGVIMNPGKLPLPCPAGA